MIWEFLRYTPTYVYLIFAYVIISGFQASRDRVISIFKPTILAVLFLSLSLDMLLRTFSAYGFSIAAWLVGSAVGACLGWLHVSKRNIKVDKRRKKIFLPGTWSTLFIALFIFGQKYYLGYIRYEHPERLQDVDFQLSALFLMGWSATFFLGRLLNYFYRLTYDLQTNLD